MKLVDVTTQPARNDAPLTVLEDMDGHTARLVLSGEVDLATSTILRSALYGIADANPDELIFDFSRLEFLSAAGAVAIVTEIRRRRPARTVIVSNDPSVSRSLTLLGAGAGIEIFPTLAEARAALSSVRGALRVC
ncbi:hypothetical protein GCM10007304_37500 [Rhodococcoides trifolii]|uniref:STAS domain-containing protein n=1 Tax=Rhodococcoides trifolii TaxID=908250 RepID=A0A917LG97_9NOCA|nr:STAS domain-containing protein [Rhodococcus trifolii]GGG20110.1 hypothetical protein GCM10007304_37500 [Rhodococcus trifolii]